MISVQNDEDIVKEVKKLKKQTDGDIVLFGGARIAQTFVKLGLIDEYQFKLQPIVFGKGMALFKKASSRISLKLIKSKTFDAGVVGLYYKPVKS